jgi:ribosomal protein S18 acetylase RimI-like enzyme
MNIRIETCESLDLLIELANLCGLAKSPNDPAGDLARILETEHGRGFVAYRDSQPIGMAMAGYEGRRGWLYYVGVIPEARRQRIAAKLVDTAVTYLGSLGAPKVLLFIRHGEEYLIDYYARLGFEPQAVTVLGKEISK